MDVEINDSGNSNQAESGNSDEDHSEGEQTFAIIIGILAGVVLLVIFLTFLGRVLGGNAGMSSLWFKNYNASSILQYM